MVPGETPGRRTSRSLKQRRPLPVKTVTLLFLDFETRSRIDLRKVGAYRYAEDPSTEATLASWALDDGEIRVWRAENAGALADWSRAAADPGVLVVAHNAEFEKQILLRRFGLDVPARRMRCTAARAARCGLPRKLGQACQVLGLAEQKDARGERLVHKFAKPRSLSVKQLVGARPAPAEEYWTAASAPEDWDDFEEYNGQDSRAMRELYRALPDLSASEQRAWEMTVQMNERGLAVDLAAIPLAARAARAAGERLAARFEALTGAKLLSPKARVALGMESLDKSHVRHALRRADLSPQVREALEIRKRAAKASVKKIAALERHVCLDGRLRGALTYAGAERTQRWSGGGVQLHNLPRGLGEGTDLAFDALAAGALDALYDDPILTTSEMLKGFFTGPFLVGDFAQVECRALAWLAGQDDLVDDFARGADVYCAMATSIYGRPISKKDFDESLRIAKRQLGKVAILGCGYGLGAEKFRKQLDEVFDVVIGEDLAERVVETYRARYPRIPAFWRLLERGFAFAVRNGSRRVRVGPTFMGTTEHGGRPFAYIELPSGRPLWYAFPKLALSDPDLPPCERRYLGEDSVSYLGRDLHTHQWGRVATYGGKLTENVVQATSRDLLLDAMFRLEDAGFALSLTVHDEAVAEAPSGLEDFTRIMNAVPPWAAGLPHAAECFATRRYRK